MLLVTISCAWVLGIFLGSHFNLSPVLMVTGLIPLSLIFLVREKKRPLIFTAAFLIAFFGAAFYYPISVSESSPAASYNGSGVQEIKGVISAEPDVKDRVTHIEVSAREISTGSNWQKLSGKILLFVPRYPEYQYGDILLIKGKLESPPQFEDFDYRAYLSHTGIHSVMFYPDIEFSGQKESLKSLEWIYALRKNLSRSLSSTLPEPQASLAQGIVLGIRSTIPDSLKTSLSITGTAHLLAISGIHLGIVAGLLITIGLRIFGRRHYTYVWLALLVIWFYALMTGMQAPVIRSAIMASIFLLAELLGRQKNAFVALAFSAAVMAGITPQILWSVSFQLSFLSMTGIIFIAPFLQEISRKIVRDRLNEEDFRARAVILITDSFSITLGAIIAVWPIIAYNFGIISFIGPVSTFLIAPALPFIIITGVLTALAGLVSNPAGQIAGWIAWPFLSYMLWMVNAFAGLSWAAASSNAGRTLLWTYYSVLFILIWIKYQHRKLIKITSCIAGSARQAIDRTADIYDRIPKKWIIPPLLVIAFLTSFTAATMPDHNLSVSILDVGTGDAIFVRNRNQNILIDGGPSPQAVCLELSRRMPFWDRSLDLVVLTHPHFDHLNGLIEVLHRYKVRQVLAPNLTPDSPFFQEWLNLIEAKNIQYTLAMAGQQIVLRNGAILDVLNPENTLSGDFREDMDDNGIVMRLTHDRISFLFMADVGQPTEENLISRRADLSCSVLKVGHHGSSTSSTAGFLNAARPQIAVISVGADNTFGHPSTEVLNRLGEYLGPENRVYRTDENGTIEFTTDGEHLWVKKER